MKKLSLGFIGGGRITRIFLQAFKNKAVHFEEIAVFDINNEVLNSLKSSFPEINIVEDVSQVVTKQVVFIALHPPVIMETLSKIKDQLTNDAVMVSLAPKFTIEKISSLTGKNNVVRLIPNATSFINEGYNPVCFAGNFDPEKKLQITELLSLLGKTFEVQEPKLESYAIVSAMLPTYFWFQWEEMRKIGLLTGLTEAEASETIHETLSAALNLMFNSGLSFSEVVDLIPVKPIAEHEPEIRHIFQTRLPALFEKIKP